MRTAAEMLDATAAAARREWLPLTAAAAVLTDLAGSGEVPMSSGQ
jgi:hypothetical protein